jgi:glycosyltransferase involved in cell wall biosynthesis
MKKKILKIMSDWSSSPERETLNSYGGYGYYRTLKIAEQLEPEYEVTVWNREWKDKLEEFERDAEKFYTYIFTTYDIVWLHQTDNDLTFAWLRSMATHFKKKLIMDCDDLFLEVDPGNPAGKKLGRGKLDRSNKRAMLATNMSFCDALTVSTLPLKEKLQEHITAVHGECPPIYIVPNANDINDWQHEKVKDNGVIIGYSGGLSHNDDLDLVLPAIKTVMEKYPDVRFQLMGQMDLKKAKQVFGKWEQSLRSRILLMNATRTQPEYPKYLSEQPWSIGIAPLIDSPFNQCKSHIKWMEYSMYAIPVVASRVYPYYKDVLGRETIEHEETGLLCDTVEDWVTNLSRLIEDETLRKRLGENAYKHVKDNWQYKDLKKHIVETVAKF